VVLSIPELVAKEELRKAVEKLIGISGVKKALKDPHAYRKPRPCGFTVHTGIGCSLRCAYCYIEDMGFEWSIREYPLTGYEMTYALLSNPYFLPGPTGSLIAIGSVTEPFHGLTRRKTLEYIEAFSKFLKNPVQFSTKMYITYREAVLLKSIDPLISPLVTIVSIKYADRLEPLAPKPEKRFETLMNLRKAGLKPFLFLRPIIPGLIDDEYVTLVDKAREYGAVGVVAGSLRITEKIVKRLAMAGVNVDEILRRAVRKPRGSVQVSIDTSDLKAEIMSYTRRSGLVFFPEACMANMYTHGHICWKMIRLGIVSEDVSNSSKPPYPSRSSIYEIAEAIGVNLEDVAIKDFEVILWTRSFGGKEVLLSELIHSRYRVCVKLRSV